ncbi:MAG: hypothetical protein DME04_26845 [Candidatus Rokuibacteriota bacterium]|nr:MAG: hypothetical protein DME04_26845 [Candidatus Rokubacteria bacterium]
MIKEPELTSPSPDCPSFANAVDCDDCDRIKELGAVPRTSPLVRSQYGEGLVCQECEEERRRVDTLIEIGDLVMDLRHLAFEDVAEIIIRRNLSPVHPFFRKLQEFVDEDLRPWLPSRRRD